MFSVDKQYLFFAMKADTECEEKNGPTKRYLYKNWELINKFHEQ